MFLQVQWYDNERMAEAAIAFTNSKWEEHIGSNSKILKPCGATIGQWLYLAMVWVKASCLTVPSNWCRIRSLCSNTVGTGKKRSWRVNVYFHSSVSIYSYMIFKWLNEKWLNENKGVSIALPAIKIKGPYSLINILYWWPSARLQ